MVAASREELLALLSRYQRPDMIPNAFELAWTRAQLELRYLSITPSVVHRFQELASYMLYPHPRMRASRSRILDNKLGQSALWAYGISGDLPTIAVSIGDPNGLPVLREILLAWQFWRIRGLDVDLIILNREQPSYDLPLRHALTTLIETRAAANTSATGKIVLLDWYTLDEAHQTLILATARVGHWLPSRDVYNDNCSPASSPYSRRICRRQNVPCRRSRSPCHSWSCPTSTALEASRRTIASMQSI